MRILQVSHSDSPGERFNGYDLMKELNKFEDVSCSMIVSKNTYAESVGILNKKNQVLQNRMVALGKNLGVENLISPWVKMIVETQEWKNADVVHYQLLRGFPISAYEMNRLFEGKKAVWTIHNSWPFTGGCIHPLQCEKWKNGGCHDCARQDAESVVNSSFASEEYQYKKKCYKMSDFPIIVTTDYMKDQISQSILSKHPVYKIPFGLKKEEFESGDINGFCKKYGIHKYKFTIGFRNNNGKLKGTKYIFEALRLLIDTVEKNEEDVQKIQIISVGGKEMPDDISRRVETHSLEWLNGSDIGSFYEKCDIFLMPSLAESFGLMSIEAMAHGCVVITFKSTAPAEIIGAPKYGVAVKYGNSTAITEEILHLLYNDGARERLSARGKEYVKEMYSFENYVKAHMMLYEKMIQGSYTNQRK